MAAEAKCYDRFAVPRWMDTLGASVGRYPGVWMTLGALETRLMSEMIEGQTIDRPIYVAGLARSGSTILLELLSAHPDIATHRYRDYPAIHIPCFWNWFLERAARGADRPIQRSHGDGIRVTPDSPEALEEILWMAFFPNLHDPFRSHVLDARTRHPAFEKFYVAHLRKLLGIRDGERYLAKGNYNITRMEYLLKLFPDARFVIPVREPVWHVASLMKQHALFCEAERRHPAALRYMQTAGHFEFGLDRRPINTGDRESVARIVDLWRKGREVEAWARLWSCVYRYVTDRLDANPALCEATMIVHYEELCRSPIDIIEGLFRHCELSAMDGYADRAARRIRPPGYYAPSFDGGELDTIRSVTAETAERLDYDRSTFAAA